MVSDSAPPLRVGAALPDPPFELAATAGPAGFDPEMMREVARRLGRGFELVRYTGGDFDGIFAGLKDGAYDVVASGTTVTDHRRGLALFCRPYVRSGQSLVAATDRTPRIGSTDDLDGGVLGVQRGNTSEPLAVALERGGRVREVRRYDYDAIVAALDDLEAGRIDAFMKLEPVTRWLVRDRPRLQVVQAGITHEELAVAVRLGDTTLAAQIDETLDGLRADGTLTELGQRWLHFDTSTSGTQVLT